MHLDADERGPGDHKHHEQFRRRRRCAHHANQSAVVRVSVLCKIKTRNFGETGMFGVIECLCLIRIANQKTDQMARLGGTGYALSSPNRLERPGAVTPLSTGKCVWALSTPDPDAPKAADSPHQHTCSAGRCVCLCCQPARCGTCRCCDHHWRNDPSHGLLRNDMKDLMQELQEQVHSPHPTVTAFSERATRARPCPTPWGGGQRRRENAMQGKRVAART